MTQPIPQGYKQTEIGVIPEDWEICSLGELVTFTSGECPSTFAFVQSGVPYFKVEQLNLNSVYADETPYFIEREHSIDALSVIFPKRGASIFSNKIRILKNNSFFDTNLMALTCNSKLDSLSL
jgi:type I restriction enzyme S subunit